MGYAFSGLWVTAECCLEISVCVLVLVVRLADMYLRGVFHCLVVGQPSYSYSCSSVLKSWFCVLLGPPVSFVWLLKNKVSKMEVCIYACCLGQESEDNGDTLWGYSSVMLVLVYLLQFSLHLPLFPMSLIRNESKTFMAMNCGFPALWKQGNVS